MMLLGIGVAFVILKFDTTASEEIQNLAAYLGPGAIHSARTLLATLAASLITVVGVAFSVIIVVLTLASNQFGPRLIRSFMQDRLTQFVIGLFLSAFTFIISVIGALDRDVSHADFPQVSVTASVLFTLLAISAFVYLIHHVAESIRAEHVIQQVLGDLFRALNSTKYQLPGESNKDEFSERHTRSPDGPKSGEPIRCAKSGYLQAIDLQELIILASVEDQSSIRIDVKPGQFLLPGIPVAYLENVEHADNDLLQEICACFLLGDEASPEQDPEFVIRQLVDIAVRALSPGINDPHTAIACIDSLTAGILRADSCFPLANLLLDDTNKVRVIRNVHTMSGLIHCAFDQIRQYGRDSVAVTLRLLESFAKLALLLEDAAAKQAIAEQTESVVQDLPQRRLVDADRNAVKIRVDRVLDSLRSEI